MSSYEIMIGVLLTVLFYCISRGIYLRSKR